MSGVVHVLRLSLLLVALGAGFVSACTFSSTKTIASRIYDAENILITPGNNMLVTGGDGLFWMNRTGIEVHHVVPLFSQTYYTLGMAYLKGRVYVATERYLFVSSVPDFDTGIADGQVPSFDMVFTFPSNVSLPNGVSTDGADLLFVADSAYSSVIEGGSIFALRVDPTAGSVTEMYVVAQKPHVVHPNGLKYVDGTLYVTDGGKVTALQLDASSHLSVVSERLVVEHETMYDDLYLFTLHDRLVLGACDIFGGALLFVDASTGAQIAKTPLETFHAPSAWAIDPVTSQIIVTNKGVVRMHDYNWGDYVSATVWNCA